MPSPAENAGMAPVINTMDVFDHPELNLFGNGFNVLLNNPRFVDKCLSFDKYEI